MQAIWLFLLLASLVLATLSATIPLTFSSNISVSITTPAGGMQYQGAINYDAPNYRNRLELQDAFGNYAIVINRFDINKQYTLTNNSCKTRYITREGMDWFGWINFARYLGKYVFGNVLCDFYELVSSENPLIMQQACIIDAYPLYLMTTKASETEQYYFYNVVLTPQPGYLFERPVSCPPAPSQRTQQANPW